MKNKNLEQPFKEYARPMIIRSLLGSIMHTADRLVAALFIGASALVATTLISPLMFLISAIAMLFISGLGAYVGLLVGRQKEDKASRISSGIIAVLVVLGLLIMTPCLVYSREIAHLLGARGDFLNLAADYLKIFALSFPLLLAGRGLDVLILNDGSPGYSFKLNMLATLANLGLNIVAVAILDLGIKGLAAATVISAGAETVGGLWYFLKKAKVIRLVRPAFEWATLVRVLYNGLSDFSMMLVEAVMVYVVNMAFVTFLTPNHFEAYAAANILITMFYSIYLGASMGLQPMLSQMMGRGQFETLKDLIYFSVKRTVLYGMGIFLAGIPLVRGIMSLFIRSEEVLELSVFFYLTIGIATLFSNLPLQMTVFFTAINRPLESAFISCARTLLLIPLLVYFSIKWIGAGGVAVGFILADLVIIVGLFVFMNKLDISALDVYE